MEGESARISALKTRLLEGIRGRLSGVSLNGHATQRIAGNLNLAFEGVDAEALMRAMPGLAVSSGSACTSAALEPSYVLTALGLPDAQARSSTRPAVALFKTDAATQPPVAATPPQVARKHRIASVGEK